MGTPQNEKNPNNAIEIQDNSGVLTTYRIEFGDIFGTRMGSGKDLDGIIIRISQLLLRGAQRAPPPLCIPRMGFPRSMIQGL